MAIGTGTDRHRGLASSYAYPSRKVTWQLLPGAPGTASQAEKALTAMILEAEIQVVSTRSMNDLVMATDRGGIVPVHDGEGQAGRR